MTETFLGIGTKHYGERDVRPDGSYVTTKFLVFFFIPIWPLESKRIRYEIEEYPDLLKVYRYTLKRLPICWPQVFKVLALGWGLCACGIIFILTVLFIALE